MAEPADTLSANHQRTAGPSRPWKGNGFGMLALLALFALYAWQLGGFALFDVDEGAFAEASREMVTSGDWGHTTLNGLDRFDKPILVYWLQAGLMAVLGPNEWAARLPSVMCAVAAAGMAGLWAQRVWGNALRWPVTLMLVTSLGFLAIGRAATADALLNLLLALTGLHLWQFSRTGGVRDLRWAWFWASLGLLAKGPVAVLVPGAALALWSLSTDRGQKLWQSLKDLPSWGIALVVAVPWYSYAYLRHGHRFVEGFFFKHNVDRFTGTLEGHGGSLLYYALVLPLLWLPWAPLLVGVLTRARTFWKDTQQRFLLLWAGFVLVFFSLSGTKLPHYVLYGAVPLALLMAHVWCDAPRSRRMQGALWATLWVQLACVAALPWLVTHQAHRVPDAWIRLLFQTAPSTDTLWWATAGAAVCVALLATWRGAEPGRRFGAAALVSAALTVGFVLPWWGETLQGPVKAAGLWARQHPGTVVQWGIHLPSFAYYRQQAAERRAPQAGEWALVRIDRLPQLASDAPIRFSQRGLAIVEMPVKHEIKP